MKAASTLKEDLIARTKAVSDLCRVEPNGAMRCVACAHRCLIHEGREGICKVRSHRGTEFRVPWGYVGALQVDPIEKKPFFHVSPGSLALSFGMLGCDFHCGYCQNWFNSQALRDPASTPIPETTSPEDLVKLAKLYGAKVLTSTYNEPLITSEWAVEIFKLARANGLKTSYVSNGNATPEVLEYIRPYVDFYKVDLKSFRDKPYRQLGGVLAHVQNAIRKIYEMGFWLEIVTLLIPGFNDDEGELKEMAEFLRDISPKIPWHINAYHQDYKMREPDNTSAAQLIRAGEVGKKAGLHFVYLGNLPGQLGTWENTYCPNCGKELLHRRGFRILSNVMAGNKCPYCSQVVPGCWSFN